MRIVAVSGEQRSPLVPERADASSEAGLNVVIVNIGRRCTGRPSCRARSSSASTPRCSRCWRAPDPQRSCCAGDDAAADERRRSSRAALAERAQALRALVKASGYVPEAASERGTGRWRCGLQQAPRGDGHEGRAALIALLHPHALYMALGKDDRRRRCRARRTAGGQHGAAGARCAGSRPRRSASRCGWTVSATRAPANAASS